MTRAVGRSHYRRMQTCHKGEGQRPSAVTVTRAYPARSDAQEANRNPGAMRVVAVASMTGM